MKNNPLHTWLLRSDPQTTSEIFAELSLLRKHGQAMKGFPQTFDDLERELKRLLIAGRIEGQRNKWGQVEWVAVVKAEKVLF